MTRIVVLHGTGGTAASVAPLGKALRAGGYTVHAPTLPGHGTTPDALSHITWPQWLDAAARHRPDIAVGQSVGANIALALAASGLVRAAVAINPLAPDPDQIDALEWHRSRGRTMIAVPVSPLEPWAYATLPIAALLAVHHGISNTDFAAITCPVLLVSSAADDVVDPASADVVAARLSNATVSRHVLARGGHVATLDVDADELNDVVVAFVDN